MLIEVDFNDDVHRIHDQDNNIIFEAMAQGISDFARAGQELATQIGWFVLPQLRIVICFRAHEVCPLGVRFGRGPALSSNSVP